MNKLIEDILDATYSIDGSLNKLTNRLVVYDYFNNV